jgi:hypothetical protein
MEEGLEVTLIGFRRFGILMMAVLFLCGAGAYAQQAQPLGASAQSMPKFLKDAGIVERLNQPLPLATAFVDDAGKQVTLGTYFHHRPIALALVYFKCTMLCPQVLHGMAVGLQGTGLKAGKDYDVVDSAHRHSCRSSLCRPFLPLPARPRVRYPHNTLSGTGTAHVVPPLPAATGQASHRDNPRA